MVLWWRQVFCPYGAARFKGEDMPSTCKHESGLDLSIRGSLLTQDDFPFLSSWLQRKECSVYTA